MDAVRVNFGYGERSVSAKIIPAKRANAGDKNSDAANNKMNSVFFIIVPVI